MATPLHRSGPFLIAGNGEVGSRVVKMLVDAGEETVVIDNRPLPGVDFVMDALDPDALAQAGLASARAVILALSSDSTNLFAATIVRDMVPEVPIIARVNQGEDVTRIHAAGADFALSISQVAGQLLGRQLFGEEFISLEPQMRLAKASAAGLGGRDPASLRIREQSGCSLVAVERDGALDLEFDREFVFRDADILYLCGSAEAVGQYFELHPEGRKPGVDDPA
jgi:Trk K+ transport system NAD-binding subunit